METALLSPSNVVSVVVALSFAAGVNIYATILALSLMARLHWLVLPDGLGGLGSPWVLAAATVLFAGNFVADKIPGFDVAWNVAHTFIRIPAAALIAYAAAAHLSPEMHVLVTCLGAATASIAHGSKTAARLAVLPSPEPLSNAVLSTGEDGVVVGLSWLALHHPAAAVGSVAGLTVIACAAVWLGWRVVKKGMRRLSQFRRPQVVSA